MEYGFGPYDQLNKKDFEFSGSASFQFDAEPVKQRFYIGLPKWTDIKYISPNSKFEDLTEYAKFFNSIELNATHYKIYETEDINKWLQRVGQQDLLFCPKMYKGITNYGTLSGKQEMVKKFCESVGQFGNHLGPILIMLKESFSARDKNILFSFLEDLPYTDFKFFLEVRHRDWFESNTLQNELFEVLRRLGIGWVITDTPVFRNKIVMNFPIKQAFIRFVCYGDNPLDNFRILEWQKQCRYLASKGVEKVFFFLHIHNQSATGSFYDFVLKNLA